MHHGLRRLSDRGIPTFNRPPPPHLGQIDMRSGKKIDGRLDGTICASADKKQRTYDVHPDADHIWCVRAGGARDFLSGRGGGENWWARERGQRGVQAG